MAVAIPQASQTDARFSTYSGAPSLHPSLAPTFETQTTSNRSSTNRASQQTYLMPQNEKGQSPYGQAGQEAIASSSTLSSTTDPKAQDIKSWSSAFARMQDERLDKQRYEMSGNKSEEVSKLALGAKVERALARRMTGQDAQFTNTMRFTTALQDEAALHGDHDFFNCSECGLQLGHVPSPPRGTMHVKQRGVTSPRRSTKAQASKKNAETLRQAAKRQEHAEDFTELPSLNGATAATAAGMSTFVNHYAVLHLPVFANHISIKSAYQDRVKRLDERSAAAAFEQGITRRLPVSLFEANQQKAITATPSTPNPRRDSGLGIETILLAGDIHLPIDKRIASNSKLSEIPTAENTKVPDLFLRPPPEPNLNPTTIPNDWTWYPYTSEQICRRNILDAAFNILIHPIKKRRYDLQYLPTLQRYQIERIVKDDQTETQKRLAVRQLGNWVVSLEKGRSVEMTVGTVPLPWTREFEEMGSGMDWSLKPVSGMAGEVVQAWVDSMDV
ncbi:hypothetical protein NU219Hw_g153t1 [Hortaea werneckii]